MNLPIIQSILHGELRTNLANTINYRDMANAFAKLPTNLNDIEALIKKHLSQYVVCNYKKPICISSIAPDNYIRLNDDHILLELPLAIPSPTNPKEKFYQNIVKAECVRTKLAIASYAIIRQSDAVTKTDIKDTLDHLLLYIKELSDDTIHATMKIQLVCLYVELSSLAPFLLVESTDYLSFEDLVYEVFQHYPQDDFNQAYNDFIKSLNIKESIFDETTNGLPSADEFEKEIIKTKYEQFIEEVTPYDFGGLDKVKALNKSGQVKLINLIITNDTNYAVPMLIHIGYYEILKKKYGLSNAKIFTHWSKALNKSERGVKGNFNVLNPESKEDRYRYNAEDYVDKVAEDYQNLIL